MKWHRDEGLGREQNRWAMKSSEEKQRVAKVEWLKVVLGREVVLDRGILYRDELADGNNKVSVGYQR